MRVARLSINIVHLPGCGQPEGVCEDRIEASIGKTNSFPASQQINQSVFQSASERITETPTDIQWNSRSIALSVVREISYTNVIHKPAQLSEERRLATIVIQKVASINCHKYSSKQVRSDVPGLQVNDLCLRQNKHGLIQIQGNQVASKLRTQVNAIYLLRTLHQQSVDTLRAVLPGFLGTPRSGDRDVSSRPHNYVSVIFGAKQTRQL